MPARDYDFIWEIGADFQRVLYLKPGPSSMIADFEGRMQIRPEKNSDTVIVELTTENNRMTLMNGAIVLSVSASIAPDTSACTRRGSRGEPDPEDGVPFNAFGPLAVFDIFLISPDGVTSRVWAGDVVFSENVTRGG